MGIGKLAFLLAVGVFAAAQPATADGSIAKKWANEAFAAVRSGGSGTSTVHTGTPGAARTYALVTLAMYDAVNGIDRVSGNSTFAPWHVGSAGAPAAANPENAAAAAAHAVLVRLFPERASTLDIALAANCSVPIAEGSEAGCRWGRDVGNAIYEHRAGDGSHVFPQPSMPPDPGLGKLPRRFSGYHFKDIAPFGVGESVQPYLSPGPPLSSAEYAES